MRIWGKIIKDSHMLKDMTVTDDSDDTRTHKIFRSLEQICRAFDLPVPTWLDVNISDFRQHRKTRFTQDSFVGEIIDFDYLELQLLEE